jgi:hypothetical protein
LINYTGELKAFYEFVTENKVIYEWNGFSSGMIGKNHENVAVIIKSVN